MSDSTAYGGTLVQGLTLEKLLRLLADLTVGHNHDGVNSRGISGSAFESDTDIIAMIDADDDQSDRRFAVQKDGVATDLFSVNEDGSVKIPGTLKVDTVAEYSADAGVTVDGVVLKDNDIILGTDPGDPYAGAHNIRCATGAVLKGLANGVDADWLGSGVGATLYRAVESADDHCGYGYAIGSSVSCPVIWMYATDDRNAFVVKEISYQQDLADGVDRFRVWNTGLIEVPTGPLKVDTISEYAAGAGVTVDGCLIKDGKAANADKLDDLHAADLLRSNLADSLTAVLTVGADGRVDASGGAGRLLIPLAGLGTPVNGELYADPADGKLYYVVGGTKYALTGTAI